MSLAAPLGGLNTRDSVVNMRITDAPFLDNWFPRASELVQRGGSIDYATGMSGAVKSLCHYAPLSGSHKVFAATNAGLYDITVTGAVGAIVQVLTNGYWNSINFTNSAGTTYLWGANGTDTPKMFDGAAWSTPSLSPAITEGNNTITQVWVFKHRIFFIPAGSMNMYYLPIDAIQGAPSAFPLGNLFKLGGSLIAGTSWTLDSGDGPDDLLVVVTSEGQLAVYSGTDPASASSFSLVGVWFVGIPMGRRCFFQLGADVGLITENGVFPLSRLLKGGNINYASALSNKIQPSFVAAAHLSQNVQGWEGCVFPDLDMLLINAPAPAAGAVPQQFVMNTITGAWCTFSGWAPLCFLTHDSILYFGIAGGKVEKALDGALVNDNGSDIVATAHMAWNNLGAPGSTKQLVLFRALLSISGSIQLRWATSSDFDNPAFLAFTPRGAGVSGTPWDTSPWNTSAWSPDSTRRPIWRAVAHIPGYSLALWLQTSGNNGSLSWAGTDIAIVAGGIGL